MSLEDTNIDQLFKDKLASQNFEAPASFLTDLEGQLDAMMSDKKKKRGFYWWILGLIPLLLIAYISYSSFNKGTLYNYNNQSNNQASKEVEENSTDLNSNKNTSANLSTQTNVQTDKSVISKSASDSLDSKNNFKITNLNTPVSYNENRNNSGNKNTSTPSTSFQNKNNSYSRSSNSKTNFSPNIKSGNNNNKGSVIHSDYIDKNDTENIASYNKTNGLRNTINTLNINSTNYSDPITNVSTDSNITLVLASPTFIDTIKKIIFIDSVVIRDSVKITYDTITHLDSSYLKVNKNFRVESQLLFGTGLVKSLGTPNLMEATDLLSKSKIRTYDIGFELNFYWKKVSLSTGFSRYNWGDYFNYTHLKISKHDSIFIDHYDQFIVIDTNQYDTIFVPVIDTISVSDSTLKNISFVAYYSRISIPLKFGYKFDYKTWAVIPRAGINFEIRSRKEDDGIYWPRGSSIGYIPKKTSISYILQVEIRKNFNKRYVYLTPFYRKTAANLFDDNIGVGKYEVYGLHFGIGSKF